MNELLKQAKHFKKELKLENGIIELKNKDPKLFLTVSILAGQSSETTLRKANERIETIKQETKKLKEKAEKGCDKLNIIFSIRCGHCGLHYCLDCQEAIKICEEILE